jgi:hypothetical protein
MKQDDNVPVLYYCGTCDKDYADITEWVPHDRYEKLWYALRDLMEQIDCAEEIRPCADIEPYKAEAVWDDVTSRAAKALKVRP